MASRATERQKQFKKGLDIEENRRQREQLNVQIRKEKKNERLNQRRRMVGASETTPSPSAPEAGVEMDETGQYPGNGSSWAQQQANFNMPEMIANLSSLDTATQLDAVVRFRRLLSIERNPPIQEVIDTGVIPRFVEFLLREDSHPLQFESAWALTNIASGTAEHTRAVINSGAVPTFVALLRSSDDDVREQAVWALGNIAGDSPQCRDMVLSENALTPLLLQLNENSKLSMLRNATWTLSNFCRGKPQPDFALVKPALASLAQLVFSQDEEVLTDACWALSYLSDGPNEKIQAVIESGVCRRLVELLMHPTPSVQTPALRAVGNIVTGDDMQTEVVINLSALPFLCALLQSPKKGIRKEACWTISNITAGNKDQIQNVIESNIFPPLIQLLSNAEFDIKKEAAWAVSNATSGGTPEQIKYLVMQGCIPPLCDLLEANDSKVVIVALEGLDNILKMGDDEGREDMSGVNQMATFIDEADGMNKIQQLQYHENEEIYVKSLRIVEMYFSNDDDDADMAPAMDDSEQQFQFGAAQSGQPNNFNFGVNNGSNEEPTEM